MTKRELDEIEKIYLKYKDLDAGMRILKLIAYVRELEAKIKKKEGAA